MLEEGGNALLRAFRGLPRNKALIKFLSEPGIQAHLQKTENFYMQEQGKKMKKIDRELFFVIEEKNNTIELTDKGIDLLSGNDGEILYHARYRCGNCTIEKQNFQKKHSKRRKIAYSRLQYKV